MFRMPRALRQVLDQGEVHVRIEVRISEDLANQSPELKLQKSTLRGLNRRD